MKFPLFICLLSFTFLSCSSSLQTIVPLAEKPKVEDTYTIIWNGISKAYRYENQAWQREESYDYIFDVVQKRYQDHWKSIKNLHRLHPDYDGKAGDRSQSMYFEIAYEKMGEALEIALASSLGPGRGTSDHEFRNQTLEFELAGLSSFSPYTHMRIRQNYQYEKGLLEEIVELYRIEDGVEIPFMKNEETAWFYLKGKLDKAPSRW
ncbi:MAG: hypothetical protein AAFN10_01335 [Bacteroidota bacterium]